MEGYKDPGPWETGKDGKRFRRIGGMIEYESQILTTRGVLTQTQLDSGAAKEPATVRVEQRVEIQESTCPFAAGMRRFCREDCALYLKGCTLARLTDQPPAKDTKGIKCPFSKMACVTSCALYRGGGCVLTAITTTESEE